MPYILTKKEIEFIKDWLKVQRGKMSLEEFFEKWGSKKDSTKVLEDFEKVKAGEMTFEELRREDFVEKRERRKVKANARN